MEERYSLMTVADEGRKTVQVLSVRLMKGAPSKSLVAFVNADTRYIILSKIETTRSTLITLNSRNTLSPELSAGIKRGISILHYGKEVIWTPLPKQSVKRKSTTEEVTMIASSTCQGS